METILENLSKYLPFITVITLALVVILTLHFFHTRNNRKLKKEKEELKKSRKKTLLLLKDLKENQEMMLEQKEKLKVVLESIGDGVIVLDHDKRIVLVNRKTTEISGYSKQEILGSDFNSVLRFISKSKSKDIFLLQKDTKQVAITHSVSHIKNSKNKSIGSVIVFRDATKEKEVDKMKTEFVSIASHQLRTPLTGIRWYTELLLSGDSGEFNSEQKMFLESVDEQALRMIDLVNELLNVSRIDSGEKFAIIKKEEDIIQLLHNAINEDKVFSKLNEVNIVVSETVPKNLMLMLDGKKIEQAFHNIINNAVKYSKAGSEVIINMERSEDSVVFSIKDSGIGIPVLQKEHIFKKFFRADNVANGKFEGSGLGLYIVRAIIEGHDGIVWFEGNEEIGTTFFIKLPVNDLL